MTVGIRHDDLRRRNRAMVIAAVRKDGQPSRTAIARTTGLSHSTISAIASDLLEEGILAETKAAGTGATRRGRPQVALGLNPEAASIVTLVLSLNSLSATLIDYAGNVIATQERRLSTLAASKQELIEALTGAAARLIEPPEDGSGPVMRICVAIQGITDSHARTLLWSPIVMHTDIAFAAALERRFDMPVTVHNDCNMIAVALKWRHPDRYRDDFLAILLSNGIGMGLMLKGELFTGAHSSAGEFGHMIHRPGGALCRCGRRGCIEAYAGNYAIWRRARGHGDDERPVADIAADDMDALAEAARHGDGVEREAFRAAGEAIGFGIGSLFALIDPTPVAIIGQGASAFDILEPVIRRSIAATAGGQHADAVVFDTEADEGPLIREGCAMTALTGLDREIFGPGAAPDARGKEVA